MAVYRNGKKTSDLNVQSDFNVTDTSDHRFIKNRPTVPEVGGPGKYISTISETNGEISTTVQNFDTSVSETSTNDNAPTSKAVYDAIQNLGNVFHVRPSVSTYNNLPTSNNTPGDVRNVVDTDDNYVWTGTEWDPLGGSSIINTLNFVSPSASGNDISFINSVSQTKGKISATKSTIPTVSQSNAGLMSASDKIKLDSIDSSAKTYEVQAVSSNNSYNPTKDTRYFVTSSITLTLGNAGDNGLMIVVIAAQSSGNVSLKFGSTTITMGPNTVQILYSRKNSTNYISGFYGALWN